MPIEVEVISVNRYAPADSAAVTMFSTGAPGGSGLTLAQLAIAVSMRSAAAYEAQSVVKMNNMTSGSDKLEQAAQYMAEIADGTGNWGEIRNYLKNVLGITAELPSDILSYNNRMTAIAALKAKVDALTQTQQEEMIDLQTLVNRRDVAYSTSSNIVRALGSSQSGNAANL